MLNWLLYSPDINPDKILWAIFKEKVTKRSSKNLGQLEEVVDNVWQNDVELKIICRSLVYSMLDMIGAIMKTRCGCTNSSFVFFIYVILNFP